MRKLIKKIRTICSVVILIIFIFNFINVPSVVSAANQTPVTTNEFITTDTIISSSVVKNSNLIIVSGVTLTINQGASLNVAGDIILYGNLINKGSLTVNNALYANNYNDMLFGDSSINTGKFTNSGSSLVNQLEVGYYLKPYLVLSSPNDGINVTGSSVDITFESYPFLNYTINGQAGVVPNDGKVVKSLSISKGSNVITITVQDPFGNSTTKTLAITGSNEASSTITFNSNGGSAVISQIVDYNTSTIAPIPPTMGGYTFTGWYSDSGLTTTYDFATPITLNITLYAKWTMNSYSADQRNRDVNRDGIINIFDVAGLARNFNSRIGQTNWNVIYDLNYDGIIDVYDFVLVSKSINTILTNSVSLNKDEDNLIIGETDTLAANITPINASNKAVTWASSNPEIAKVDSTGKVTAVSIGTATITVTTIDGNYNSACHINVEDSIVTFKDKNFEYAVRMQLNKYTGNIYKNDVLKITTLSASNLSIVDISGIENMINLQTTYLRDNQISDLSPLQNLFNLQTLFLQNNEISDLKPLKGLINLQYLELVENQIIDLSPIDGLTNLQTLYLGVNQISDLSPLKGLVNLNYFTIDSCPIADISVLSGLTNLTAINLDNTKINDLDVLKRLPNLKGISLNNNGITDINVLEGLTNLQTLFLQNNQISDLSPLKGLISLQYLDMYGNKVWDLSPLKDLNSLQYLYLHNNQISNLNPLIGLVNLQQLWLMDNQISNLMPLKGLNNLQYLYLYNNQISDVSPLMGLTKLSYLNLYNNQISDIDKIFLRAALSNCNITF